MHTVRRRILAAAGALSLCVLAACESKLTKENFDSISNGMTVSQVEEILGSGEAQDSSGGWDVTSAGILSSGGGASNIKVYAWEEGSIRILVYFKDGQVASKSQSGLE